MVLLVHNEFVQGSLATHISYLFFADSWFTEERYWVVDVMEKTPECTYLIVLSLSLEQSLFQTKKENQKKSMETMG
jgi:hypothetical protein